MKTQTEKASINDDCQYDTTKVIDDPKAEKFAKRLKSPGRGERQRLKDLGNAIDWVTDQLRLMKEEDRHIMKQFLGMRAEINNIKEGRLENPARRSSLDLPRITEDDEFMGVKKCNLDPFDVDDSVPLRRRALTTMEFTSNQIIGLDGSLKERHQTR